MNNRIDRRKIFLLVFLLLGIRFCFAQEFKEIPDFKKDDRVLILAPHPDDEAIGTGGVIQRALKKGAKVKVVCYTNGDHNEFVFIVYEKRITFRKGEFIHMGEVRRKETLDAMSSLGLGPENIVFLGYPDFGTMEILTKYWGRTKPFKYLLTRISRVPYPECLSFGAPYVGESILKDIKAVIADFRPTKIFVSHPADTNRDHRSLYLFLQVALWDLKKEIGNPLVFPYIIHIVGWPKPRGYLPELELMPPENKFSDINWQILSLTPEETQEKCNAIVFYKSQNKANPRYLPTFARKNELFGDYERIILKQQKTEEISWVDANPSKTPEYARDEKDLLLRVPLKKKIEKDLGVSVFLLGYSKKTEFAKMPKIHIYIDILGLHTKEKKQTLFINDIQLTHKKNFLILKVPLSALGYPDYIMASFKSRGDVLSFEESGWRILQLE